MEQRRLRLGDILDDYCPRERRVTNHAIVAMIEEDIKQTRCTTCDAEHAYKGARVPRRRKKEGTAALYDEVLAGLPAVDEMPVLSAAAAMPHRPVPAAEREPDVEEPPLPETPEPAISMRDPDDDSSKIPSGSLPLVADNGSEDSPADTEETAQLDGPVHRRLIRATLPRPEGQKEARPTPDFTVRHMPVRGNGAGQGFRAERARVRSGSGFGEPNGNRGQRFQGNRGGAGRQPGRGGGPGAFRGGPGGGKGKRGRGPRG